MLAPHFVPAGKSRDNTRLMATDDGEEQTTMECFEKGEDRAKKSNTSNKLELDITGSSAMQMKQSCHILLVHVPKAIEFNIQRQKGYTGHIAVLVFRVEEFFDVQVLKLQGLFSDFLVSENLGLHSGAILRSGRLDC